ncbi:hypothetical protein PACILC2_19200 [Paenibacillus cisolokensis]|uniref:ABC transporter substrate-binding protein n=1 Tax=Paenibacillus cisolokensis TaxID=1658519 RepID=A0ABQ4N5D1_9BACL|nr:extracellular solute-binding protein [Paenibacillus cisolokensis]GIQ63352.1 hypothetical protein PACILC2_19200 [Paenibacillus cisolokensis]
MKTKNITLMAFAILAFALIVGACSKGGSNDPGDNPAGADNGSQQTETSDGETSSESELPRLQLKWFVPASPDAILPEGDIDFVGAAIEQKFNVDLNIQYMPSGADYDNKLNMLIASGDVPDLFVSTGINSQKYILDGITADMTPYVSPQTMPNYFKWVSELELQRYAVEGKFERAPLVFPRNVYRSYYIRQDWLDRLNLPVPANFEEMMDVMRAFTFDDPDGNNRNDTYGMSAIGNGDSVSYDFPHWIENGLVGAFMIRDNKLVDVQSDLAVQHVLQGIKDTMAEGIVDPDWFLMKGQEHVDKAVGGKVGIIVGGSKTFAFDSDPLSLQNKTKAIFRKRTGCRSIPLPKRAPGRKICRTRRLCSPRRRPRAIRRRSNGWCKFWIGWRARKGSCSSITDRKANIIRAAAIRSPLRSSMSKRSGAMWSSRGISSRYTVSSM